MSDHAVAHLDEIDEISDGRCPWRPVRHHFGITSFGINAWTGRKAGDRIINEHDEEGEDEELYFVHSGRARFEFDGERVDGPAGTFVFAPPGVKPTPSSICGSRSRRRRAFGLTWRRTQTSTPSARRRSSRRSSPAEAQS